jgi:hypothetical protein
MHKPIVIFPVFVKKSLQDKIMSTLYVYIYIYIYIKIRVLKFQ